MFLYLFASGILAKVASLHSTSAPKSPTSGMSELRFKYIAGLLFSTTRRGNNIHLVQVVIRMDIAIILL